MQSTTRKNGMLCSATTIALALSIQQAGFIPDTFLLILQRLKIDADEWIENT